MYWIALADLPKLKLVPVVEFRTRLERRLDRDLDESANDNRSELATRLRVGFDFTQGKNLSGKVRYQLGQSEFWTPQRNWSDEHSDIFIAQVDTKAGKDGTFTIGRQSIRKGAGRLFDESNFSQRPKSFDALRYRDKKVDAFVGRVGMTSNERDFSKVAGASYAWGGGETLVVYRRDDGDRDLSQWTLDHRWTQTSGAWNLALEGALQRGRANNLDVDAFWFHARAGYKVDKKTSVYVETNVASGGSEPNKTKTFDPLYGTGHTPYGLMDVQGLRNVRHLELGVQHKPTARLDLSVAMNLYRLYDPRDGWYSGDSIARRASGQFRDPSGAAGANVGTEWSLTATYALSKRDSISLELGLFKPGSFVKALNGAATTDQRWLLVTYNLKF